MNEKLFWLGWSQVPKVGPARFAQLLAAFETAGVAWNASEKELLPVLKPALTAQFLDFKKTFSVEEYLEKMQMAKVSFVTLEDHEYSPLLKKIKNPPFVLFVKGNLDILRVSETNREVSSSRLRSNNTPFIGIVGTRKITDYGRQVTEAITRELVDAGCVIVSGLAMGVDAVAHQITIDTGGKTIAVLGCGVDCCYPRENQRVYEEILDSGGLIVSEYGIGQQPTVGSFPSRNRIIAGLSHGVLVTEGAADSGALITAKDAVSVGRKVFAVPGPVTSSLSQGTYHLIKQGAVVISSGQEVLDELGMINQELGRQNKKQRVKGDTDEEQKIIDLLSQENLHVDELIKKTKIDPSKLGTILSLMEMKGMVSSLSAGFFRLNA
ncbi:MAG TPA: DNA-processing protein DprA [Patescibacteria group bacterium]|nr:DNA-processing protein DprA [Patescibacteria group bacterium]